MASKAQIAKLALQHIGDRYDIADLDEESVEAEQMDLLYDDIRQEVLRTGAWRFANKFTSPAKLSLSSIPANWTYAFQYPSDALKIIEIVNPLGRDLEPVEFETTLLSDDTTRFDSTFVMAFSYMLAARAAMSLTGDIQIKDDLTKEAARAISNAHTQSANEGRTKRAPEASWIDARQ